MTPSDGHESGRHEPADRVLDAAPRKSGRGLERGELGTDLGVALAVPPQDEQDASGIPMPSAVITRWISPSLMSDVPIAVMWRIQ